MFIWVNDVVSGKAYNSFCKFEVMMMNLKLILEKDEAGMDELDKYIIKNEV